MHNLWFAFTSVRGSEQSGVWLVCCTHTSKHTIVPGYAFGRFSDECVARTNLRRHSPARSLCRWFGDRVRSDGVSRNPPMVLGLIQSGEGQPFVATDLHLKIVWKRCDLDHIVLGLAAQAVILMRLQRSSKNPCCWFRTQRSRSPKGRGDYSLGWSGAPGMLRRV
jgi:hypothetical protein